MAHEIDMTNGRANMAYAGETPWHGLGQKLTYGSNIEVWKKEAGMDWTVEESELMFKGKSTTNVFPDRRVLYRSDNDSALSVVSGKYQIVHPGEALDFFRDLVAAYGFELETAGCLFGGRKYWAMAKIGKGVQIKGVDEVTPYLLMATSCDGSMATAVHATTVRTVCNNTLRMAIGENAQAAQIKVSHSVIFDPQSIKSQLGLLNGAWTEFVDNATKLAGIKLDRDFAIDLVASELKKEWKRQDGSEMTSEEMLDASNVLRRIVRLYDGEAMGGDIGITKGTAWGLVNAVTEFFDHEAGGRKERSRTFERAHLTDRAALKVNVANRLLQLA